MPKRLNPAVRYNMMVTGTRNHKTFSKNNTPHNVHLIFFTDKYGVEYVGEYVTTTNEVPFIPGMLAVFKVIEVQALGDIIMPLPDVVQEVEKELLPEFLKPITGESYHLAMEMAIRLKTAEMDGCLTKVADADIDQVLEWAKRIDGYFIEKQTERITGECII